MLKGDARREVLAALAEVDKILQQEGRRDSGGPVVTVHNLPHQNRLILKRLLMIVKRLVE
jgi:hypothetical protein